jgi:hypothetical protein
MKRKTDKNPPRRILTSRWPASPRGCGSHAVSPKNKNSGRPGARWRDSAQTLRDSGQMFRRHSLRQRHGVVQGGEPGSRGLIGLSPKSARSVLPIANCARAIQRASKTGRIPGARFTSRRLVALPRSVEEPLAQSGLN